MAAVKNEESHKNVCVEWGTCHNYTSTWCMMFLCWSKPSALLEDERALDAPISRCSRKSVTTVSVQGAPKGASSPATHPRWPPFGVTINKQFGFSWENWMGSFKSKRYDERLRIHKKKKKKKKKIIRMSDNMKP